MVVVRERISSAGRTSISVDNAVLRSGKAIDQWLGPKVVSAPLVIKVWATVVPVMVTSQVTVYWSQMRLAGTHDSR